MALDSEAKRWSMLQIAGGPSYYPFVFNPDTSGVVAIERATLLKLYGGIPLTETPEPEVEVVATRRTGGGSSLTRRRYPRLVLINGRRTRVKSAVDERRLLAAYQAELEREETAIRADAAPAAPALKRVRQQIAKTEARIEDARYSWEQFLADEDEELITLLYG